MVPTPVYVNEDSVSMGLDMIMEDLQQVSRINTLPVMSSLHLSEVALEEKVFHKNRHIRNKLNFQTKLLSSREEFLFLFD